MEADRRVKTNLIISRIVLFISFVLVNIITTRIAIRGIFGILFGMSIEQHYYFIYILSIVLSSGLSLLIFELVSKYYFALTAVRKGNCLPADVPRLVYKLRYYFVVRNVIVALISIAYIFYPILYIKGNSLFSMAATLIMIIIFYLDVKKSVLINVNDGTFFDLAFPILIIEIVLLIGGLL